MQGSILLVARNNVHLTKLALKSALAQTTQPHIFLIDNASTDGTMAWSSSIAGERVSVVTLLEQKSLAACWNMGLKFAFNSPQSDGKCLVINNDIEMLPHTYSYLASQKSDFLTAVSVGSRQQFMEEEIISDTPELTVPKHRLLEETFRPHPDFSCFMISRECFEKTGQFNEDLYPAYCEDSFYHVRMHRLGINAGCISLPFLHHGASTIKSASAFDRRVIERGSQRNRDKFKKAYGCYPGTPEYEALFS